MKKLILLLNLFTAILSYGQTTSFNYLTGAVETPSYPLSIGEISDSTGHIYGDYPLVEYIYRHKNEYKNWKISCNEVTVVIRDITYTSSQEFACITFITSRSTFIMTTQYSKILKLTDNEIIYHNNHKNIIRIYRN